MIGLAAQAATEVARGGGSSIFLDGTLLVIIATQGFSLWRSYVDRKTVKLVAARVNKKQDDAATAAGLTPGFEQTCREHGEAIVELRTKQGGYDKDAAELKTEVREIKGDIKDLTSCTIKIAARLGVEVEERKRGEGDRD